MGPKTLFGIRMGYSPVFRNFNFDGDKNQLAGFGTPLARTESLTLSSARQMKWWNPVSSSIQMRWVLGEPENSASDQLLLFGKDMGVHTPTIDVVFGVLRGLNISMRLSKGCI